MGFEKFIHAFIWFATICTVLIFFFHPVQAEDAKTTSDTEKSAWSVKAGVGVLSGHTTYQIGGQVNTSSSSWVTRFPLSELRFTFDEVPYGFIQGKYENPRKFSIESTLKINTKRGSGKLFDSDWGIFYDKGIPGAWESSLDVYSTSDTEVDFIFSESEISFPVHRRQRFLIMLGFGFTYKSFSFSAFNLHQTYPSCSNYGICALYPDIRITEKVLTYDIQYYIPKITATLQHDHFAIWKSKLHLGVAPIIFIHDVDDHILRSKRNTGNSQGQAYNVDLETSLFFSRNVILNLQLQYSYYNTRGVQRQVYYKTTAEASKGTWAEIENKIFSSQLEFILAMQFLFH